MNPHSIMRGLGAVLVTLAAPLVLAQDGPVTARSVAAQHLPRQADGHADLNGTWDNGSGYDFLHPEHLAGGSVCVAGCDAPAPAAAASAPAPKRAPPNFPKYRPEYLAKVAQLNQNQLQLDPVLH